MLSAQQNELLTRVGRGTPMGALMRSYWLPAVMSSELVADGRPVRVRLLGEALVAFRDSGGQVGLLAEHCPHRQVSLYFGRNEQGGLRCVYHGWKFDRTGACMDLPSEPPGSPMAARVRADAYPCQERGGVVWAYLGEGEPPQLPDFEWALVPEQHRYMSKRLLECNWAQALEGDIDSSHASFLHSSIADTAYSQYERPARAQYMHADGHPHYEVERRPYGLQIAARRNIPGTSQHYWRVAQYILPVATLPAPYEDELYRCNLWVPVDDHTTMTYVVDWHPSRPVTDQEKRSRSTGLTAHCLLFEDDGWRPAANRDNDYLHEAQRQRRENYSGIREIWAQDKAVVESMGTVLNRTREHLGSSDRPLIEFRRLLLDAVKQEPGCRSGSALPSMRVRSGTFVLSASEDWHAAAAEHARADAGTPPHPQTV